jgi:hypothetical protein
MVCYRIAGYEYSFSCPVPELRPYKISSSEEIEPLSSIPAPLSLSCRAVGWIGEAEHEVECWSAPPGLLLRVSGGKDFYIPSGGRAIVPVEGTNARSAQDRNASLSILKRLDREILAGPALVLALALRGTWCLHASAALFQDRLFIFLGESGQGKSTLSAFLVAAGSPGWRLVADDILPVTLGPDGLTAWLHFPQLKLPGEAKPGAGLQEQLLVSKICVLAEAKENEMDGLHLLTAGQSVQVYLGHTAGTRLFGPDLLEKHLVFCTQAASRLPVHRLAYKRRLDALPVVKQLLEKLC